MSDQFPIEKDVAVPQSHRRVIYPFADMDVGDSFFALGVTVNDVSRVRSSATNYGYRHKMKFTTRAVEGGIRVWRVE